MEIALVSLPWAVHLRPSAAVGALAAIVRAEAPSHDLHCVSAYVEVADAIGFDLYETIAERCYKVGEPLWMTLLHPERIDAVLSYLADHESLRSAAFTTDWHAAFAEVRSALDRYLDALAERLAGCDLLGLTTSFGQLFGNVALATRIKARSPGTIVVLGGSSVSSRVGPSLLAEFPAVIDHVVQGEGERPFVELIRALDEKRPLQARGILSRSATTEPAELWEVESLDALPPPDYDEYAARADELGLLWELPIEGSRGCWWDRTKRSGDPKATCYFCNLNVQWGGYREKSIQRLVQELDTLSERYANTQIYFLDNIIRARGIEELANGIAALKKDFDIAYEMRANVRPHELLAMREAGLKTAQFGIEALADSVLQKIGKGTTVIQNLEVLKTCRELGIRSTSNLIFDFPGCTDADVEATCDAIRKWALPYDPTSIATFHLGLDCTVDALRAEFGIGAVKNNIGAQVGLPAERSARLTLLDLDFERLGPRVSWEPVREACEYWARRQREVEGPLLCYWDGGTFLRIQDRRVDHELFTLQGLARDLYLFCMEIRSLAQIAARLSDAVTPLLDELVDARLMYRQGRKYLSLALASSPEAAARRIRAARNERRDPVRLAVTADGE